MPDSTTTEPPNDGLEHRERQLDLTLTALLRIYRTHGGKEAREIARQTLADILGFKEQRS